MEDLKKLLAAATPGPWTHASDKLAAGNIKAPDNAALIVAAVNALPDLIAMARRVGGLEAALKRMLLEFDFLVEAGNLPDIRNDMIFDEARAALTKDTQ